MEKNRQTPTTELSDNLRGNYIDEFVAWNGLLKRFFDKKREEQKKDKNRSRIKNAFDMYKTSDEGGKEVEFISSSSSNRFKNMVTIKPAAGTEGPEEVFIWSAANPAGEISDFSEQRIARLRQAMGLVEDPLGETNNG